MIYFITEMAFKKFWYRYYCFSLFKADRINRVLLYLLLPFSLAAYYYSDMQTSTEYQWYIYFNKKEFFILGLAIIIYNHYKHTRDAAIATGVLIACIYNTIQEMMGLQDKYAYIEVVWVIMMYGLIIHSLYKYISNARKNRCGEGDIQ